jgi:hypothetical protein
VKQPVDQRRLADARLAGDEHDLAFARERALQPFPQPGEFPVAAEDALRRSR